MDRNEDLVLTELPHRKNINTELPSKKMGVSKVKVGIIFAVAIVAIAAGIAMGMLWSSIFDGILSRQLILSPTSKSFSIWKETPIPMYLKIYLFHWTNPQLIRKEKPHFIEKGPYVFKEIDYKVNRTWNDNGTLTFYQRRIWHFLPEESNGTLDDQIVNLNPIAATLAYKVRYKRRFMQLLVSGILEGLHEGLTVTKTVRELLFDGYEDDLINFAKKYDIPGIPWDKFGWFYGRNGSETYDGIFNMNTGANNMKEIGILHEWNHSDKSKIYTGKCGQINGTLGDLWPPVRDYEDVSVFAPDVCTLVPLKDNGHVNYDGLEGKQFIATPQTFDNGSKVESRGCYCKDIECQPSGTLNVSTCKFGAPAFISLPHFHLADESYLNAIDGLKPANDGSHDFSILVQPDLGIPLQVKARLQLNLLIQPMEHIGLFANVPKVFIPMLWFRQEADLSSDLGSQLKFVLILPTLGHVTFFGIAGLGLLIFFIGGVVCIRGRRKAEDNQRLIARAETNGSNRTEG
ncbi:protein croquemort isoform X2 [Fopius arisanus]|uniref:Protein croquemort isoform X2 n=1 Tax=Fopius arisanus TaxID=64838 RepID=A0A9R1T095_9HYME|nr:PREDICTED: protein croquemort isoform X2 [Fopius arisanus]